MSTLPGIYIHIPFCRKRCAYCDYLSNALDNDVPVPAVFLVALCDEIRRFEGPDSMGSVFIGGGTPSLLTMQNLDMLFNALHHRFTFLSLEITLEANPDDITKILAAHWKQLGINRVSIGVQSFSDTSLRYLGRRHDAAKARSAVTIIGNLFDNWSIDLIFGAPDINAWGDTLATAITCQPPHVSTYALSYEPGTPLDHLRKDAFNDDTMLMMYQQAEMVFSHYNHYEISNYAIPGKECRHNLIYWHNGDYAGFGPGAYSYLEGKRMRNECTLASYLEAPGSKMEVQQISLREQQIETLIQCFRLQQGIEEKQFSTRFGKSALDDFRPVIDVLIERGLLQRSGKRIYPTQQGFYLNNEIGMALVDLPE